MVPDEDPKSRQYLLARFWDSRAGVLAPGEGDRAAWALDHHGQRESCWRISACNTALNVWNRPCSTPSTAAMGTGALHQALVFFPLISAIVGVNAALTYV
jgi:hypothetical protein